MTGTAASLEPAAADSVERARNPYSSYLTQLESEESRRTMRGCLIRVARLISPGEEPPDAGAFAESVPWHKIGRAEAIALRAKIISHAETEGWSLAHVNKHLAAVRGVVAQSWELEYIDADTRDRARSALRNVKGTRKKRGRHVEEDEVIRLLTVTAAEGRPVDKRDAAIISAFHATGGRCSEVAAMRIERYDRRTSGTVFHGKGNKEREAYLHDDAARYMEDWLGVLGATRGPVFRPVDQWGHIGTRGLTSRSLGRIINRRRQAAGLDPIASHDFRRTLVGDMLDQGADLATVQETVGHASPVTTAGYDRRPGRRIREAVKRRNPGVHGTAPAGDETVPPGEPLTHFFHCWRFPDHHACAVALIERQAAENDSLLFRVAAAERAAAELSRGESGA